MICYEPYMNLIWHVHCLVWYVWLVWLVWLQRFFKFFILFFYGIIVIIILYFEKVAYFHAELESDVCPRVYNRTSGGTSLDLTQSLVEKMPSASYPPKSIGASFWWQDAYPSSHQPFRRTLEETMESEKLFSSSWIFAFVQYHLDRTLCSGFNSRGTSKFAICWSVLPHCPLLPVVIHAEARILSCGTDGVEQSSSSYTHSNSCKQ